MDYSSPPVPRPLALPLSSSRPPRATLFPPSLPHLIEEIADKVFKPLISAFFVYLGTFPAGPVHPPPAFCQTPSSAASTTTSAGAAVLIVAAPDRCFLCEGAGVTVGDTGSSGRRALAVVASVCKRLG